MDGTHFRGHAFDLPAIVERKRLATEDFSEDDRRLRPPDRRITGPGCHV